MAFRFVEHVGYDVIQITIKCTIKTLGSLLLLLTFITVNKIF